MANVRELVSRPWTATQEAARLRDRQTQLQKLPTHPNIAFGALTYRETAAVAKFGRTALEHEVHQEADKREAPTKVARPKENLYGGINEAQLNVWYGIHSNRLVRLITDSDTDAWVEENLEASERRRLKTRAIRSTIDDLSQMGYGEDASAILRNARKQPTP